MKNYISCFILIFTMAICLTACHNKNLKDVNSSDISSSVSDEKENYTSANENKEDYTPYDDESDFIDNSGNKNDLSSESEKNTSKAESNSVADNSSSKATQESDGNTVKNDKDYGNIVPDGKGSFTPVV